jgi:AAA family ATP:ADP antiporter
VFKHLLSFFRSDLAVFTREQKRFSFYTLVCIFLVMAEYGMSAPVSSSLFLSYFSAYNLPYVWLFTVPLNFLIVAGYNQLLPVFGPKKTFTFTLILISTIHVLSACFVKTFPPLIFFQYAFRDIYILLLFKQIWSMIHATMNVSKAKYLYSLPFIVGSIGAIFGSRLPASFALFLGSSKLFFLTSLFYLFLYYFYKKALVYGNSKVDKNLFSQKTKGGFSLINNSRYLKLILTLVLFMQLTVALVYFQFNLYLDQAFTDIDLRTAYMGKIHFFISSASLVMQVFISALLIRILGLKRAHLLVPITLFSNSLLFLLKPTLSTISYLYSSVKALDFSFFCLIREQLYTPLNIDEKYRAKAIIDIFVYRSSKALASVILLFFPISLIPLSYVSIVIFCLWIIALGFLFKKKKQTVPSFSK